MYNELGQTSEIAFMAKELNNSASAQYIPMPQRQSIYRGSAETTNSNSKLSSSISTNKTTTTATDISNNTVTLHETLHPSSISIPLQWQCDNSCTMLNKSQQPPLPFNVLNLRYLY